MQQCFALDPIIKQQVLVETCFDLVLFHRNSQGANIQLNPELLFAYVLDINFAMEGCSIAIFHRQL